VALNWFKKKKNSDENKKDQDNSTSSGETSFFERLKKGLSKTREILSTDIDELFTGKKGIDDSLLEELEELLITSDIGVQLSMELIQRISKKSSKISDANQLKNALKEEMLSLLNLQTAKQAPETASAKPLVIMVIGVNGVGKTTTIGKLAAKFNSEGKKVLIAATDTFRAAAIEQLVIWAGRAGAQIVKHKDNADPASVAYDSIEAAIARDIDIVLVDTAGRIHTKVNLMEELKKIKRTISKKLAGAPHEILLVLDATTGQNALSQAELFDNALGVTGIALTKLDGTAKGGIVVSICNTLKIQLKYIGIGEKIDDLQDFNSKEFVDALF
jgi:fused signal recognition particle receptor